MPTEPRQQVEGPIQWGVARNWEQGAVDDPVELAKAIAQRYRRTLELLARSEKRDRMYKWELDLQYPDAQALKRLIDAHPRVFRDEVPRVHSHLPPGWYDLAHQLFLDIEQLLGDEIELLEVLQIKEKFASLRVYFSFDGESETVIDLIAEDGRARLRKARRSEVVDRVLDLVEAADLQSQQTCQECGAPGEVVGAYWRRTLCETHAEEQQRRDKEREG